MLFPCFIVQDRVFLYFGQDKIVRNDDGIRLFGIDDELKYIE